MWGAPKLLMNCVVNLVWPQFAAKLPALMVRILPFPSYWRSEKKDSSLYKNGYPLLHHIQEDKKFKDFPRTPFWIQGLSRLCKFLYGVKARFSFNKVERLKWLYPTKWCAISTSPPPITMLFIHLLCPCFHVTKLLPTKTTHNPKVISPL